MCIKRLTSLCVYKRIHDNDACPSVVMHTEKQRYDIYTIANQFKLSSLTTDARLNLTKKPSCTLTVCYNIRTIGVACSSIYPWLPWHSKSESGLCSWLFFIKYLQSLLAVKVQLHSNLVSTHNANKHDNRDLTLKMNSLIWCRWTWSSSFLP